MNILSSSILAADFFNLGDNIKCVENAGMKYLHFDVMDGMFVPSISFGLPVLESIRKKTDLFLDVHLMIEQPERYLEEFAKAGADLINFHLEATKNPDGCIEKIRSLGKKVGITIKPATPAEAVFDYLDKVDMVLVMTVEPGFGGQKLIGYTLDKVKTIRDKVNQLGLNTDIEVDGGINSDNVTEAIDAGANVIVAGSAVFRGNIEENLRLMREKGLQ